MADVLYIYWHVKFAKSSVLVKQLTDLDFVGTTIKRVIGNFGRVKRCLQYFLIKKHKRFFENIDNCLIDKVHSSDANKIEYYWMRKLWLPMHLTGKKNNECILSVVLLAHTFD